mmetsp:Transcript_56419/g.133953  ORF Transcript_56419/g.133953 Transcript_56419/m.133953 type:complete len:204 (+) Transcript_56419:4103-4714(+)
MAWSRLSTASLHSPTSRSWGSDHGTSTLRRSSTFAPLPSSPPRPSCSRSLLLIRSWSLSRSTSCPGMRCWWAARSKRPWHRSRGSTTHQRSRFSGLHQDRPTSKWRSTRRIRRRSSPESQRTSPMRTADSGHSASLPSQGTGFRRRLPRRRPRGRSPLRTGTSILRMSTFGVRSRAPCQQWARATASGSGSHFSRRCSTPTGT